jgi:hypothetical protein
VKKLSRAERVRLEELTTTDDAIIYPYPSEVLPVRLQFIRLHEVINAVGRNATPVALSCES